MKPLFTAEAIVPWSDRCGQNRQRKQRRRICLPRESSESVENYSTNRVLKLYGLQPYFVRQLCAGRLSGCDVSKRQDLLFLAKQLLK